MTRIPQATTTTIVLALAASAGLTFVPATADWTPSCQDVYGEPICYQIEAPIAVQRFTIHGTDDDLIDFQVQLLADTASAVAAGTMQPDCSDVRFFANPLSGAHLDLPLLGVPTTPEVPLPYWLESGCGTQQTMFWVRIPSIPAGSQTPLFLVHGEHGFAGGSDGDATFLFFDGFDESDVDWSQWQAESTYYRFEEDWSASVDGGTMRLHRGWDNQVVFETQATFEAPVTIESRVFLESQAFRGYTLSHYASSIQLRSDGCIDMVHFSVDPYYESGPISGASNSHFGTCQPQARATGMEDPPLDAWFRSTTLFLEDQVGQRTNHGETAWVEAPGRVPGGHAGVHGISPYYGFRSGADTKVDWFALRQGTPAEPIVTPA